MAAPDTRGTTNIRNFNENVALEISCKFHPALFPSNNKVDKLQQHQDGFSELPKGFGIKSVLSDHRSRLTPAPAPLLPPLVFDVWQEHQQQSCY